MTGEQEVKVLAEMTHLARVMNSEMRPERVYEAILEAVVRAVDCEEVELYLYEARYEHPSRLVRRIQGIAVSEELTRERASVLFAERAVLAEAARQRETMLSAPQDRELAWCVVPLVARGRLQALLAVGRSVSFSEKDKECLSQVGEVAAAALAQVTLSIQEQERQVRFLSKLSHELRSPLNAINGYLDLALSGMGGELNTQQREFMQRARAGSEYLYALMEDLLLLGRANINQLRLRRQVARLSEIVENAVEDLELTVEDAHVKIETRIPVHLPPIYVDPVRMQQVLRNLLTYALEQAGAGAVVLVSAMAEQAYREGSGEEAEHGGMLRIEIETDVKGKVEERQELARALSIARLIMELHGGKLEWQEREGRRRVLRGLLPVLLT